MFLTNFLSEFVYCILSCYAHMNILQMEYAHYKCKLLLFIIYYLRHERPCCISIYKLGPKVRVVYLISDTTWMRML